MTKPLTLSRRSMLLGAAAAGLAVTASGCALGGNYVPGPSNLSRLPLQNPPAYIAAPVPEGAIVSDIEGVPMMVQRPLPTDGYSPSVAGVPAKGGRTTTFQINWGAPPRTINGGNTYWEELNERLGTQWAANLVAPGQYNDKLSTVLAGGLVPDLTFLQDQTSIGAQALEDGAYLDLTDYLAGDAIKDYPNLAAIPTRTWEASNKNGRIYGVPNQNNSVPNFPIFRADLLELAGYDAVPDTVDGFLQMMIDIGSLKRAHGKDIWALDNLGGLNHMALGWLCSVGPDWQLRDGKVVHVLETENFVNLMQLERDLWNGGAVHPDAFAPSVSASFGDGKIAMNVGSPEGYFLGGLKAQYEKTPETVLAFYELPSIDGKGAQPAEGDPYWGLITISRDSSPERAKELLRVLNYLRAPYGSEEWLFLLYGSAPYLTFDDAGIPVSDDPGNDKAMNWTGVRSSPYALLWTAPEDLGANFIPYIEGLTKRQIPNTLAGLYSQTRIRNGARIDELGKNYINGIIRGQYELGAGMAEYREQFLNAGGVEIKTELQAAYEATQE